jgi:heme a synthase
MPETSHTDSPRTISPWLRRAAVCLACATFPLIFVGGLVTTTRAGMAVPDWPSTYGYNLFLYPWETWAFGPWKLFVEHGHRLFGSLVGFLAIVMLTIAIRTRAPRGFVIGAVVTLLLVCFQGFLGGARVLLESRGILDGRSIAFLHGCTGPLFFTYAVLYAVATSRLPSTDSTLKNEPTLSGLKTASLLLALLATAQLIFGASLRHVPDTAEPSYFRIMTLMHLLFAAALFVQSLLLSGRILSRPALRKTFSKSASLLLALLVAQIALGVMTWVLKYGYPPSLPLASYFAQLTLEHQSLLQITTVTAHVANGSLVLALAARLAFVSRRYSSLSAPLAAVVLAEGLR